MTVQKMCDTCVSVTNGKNDPGSDHSHSRAGNQGNIRMTCVHQSKVAKATLGLAL